MIKKQKKEARIISFRKDLLAWYDSHKRDMPWRRTSDPYAIWLSEIMLQQTTVATVTPYFNRFLKKFSTLKALADASIDELLKEWSGLGYYNRIRNFHSATHQIINEHGGVIPHDHDTLLTLKGFGPYTAAAVSSIAFNEPRACVDGNVMRVIARLDAYKDNIKNTSSVKFFKQRAQELLDASRAGDFNQAMMELGATVCSPTQPKCLICPVSKNCLAFQQNLQEQIPIKSKQVYQKKFWECYAIVSKQDKILLRQRSNQTVMRDMWELPHFEDDQSTETNLMNEFKKTNPEILGNFSHAIMNQRIKIKLFKGSLRNETNFAPIFRWIPLNEVQNFALTTVTKKAFKLLHKHVDI